ncbi:MAG: abortive infection bacteriophage resistance protein [Lentimonas sp.]|jgi:abortive infection bacteriophage resistance protein
MSTKPFKTYAEQLKILQNRGLTVNDEDAALHILKHHSYYRFSAYRFPFQDAIDRFRTGTTFADLWALYCFDRIMRQLVSEACKAVELSIRARWAYCLSEKYGSQAYEVQTVFRNLQRHTQLLARLDKELNRSDEVFVTHYRNNHGMQRPPIWGACELMSFGLLSRFFENISRTSDKKGIAQTYDLSVDGLKSFLEHSVYLRNLCAHHSRIWNRRFTITVSLPQSRPFKIISSLHPPEGRRIYNLLVLLGHMLSMVEPKSDWKQRLRVHLETLNGPSHTEMGFPADWRERDFWKNPL